VHRALHAVLGVAEEADRGRILLLRSVLPRSGAALRAPDERRPRTAGRYSFSPRPNTPERRTISVGIVPWSTTTSSTAPTNKPSDVSTGAPIRWLKRKLEKGADSRGISDGSAPTAPGGRSRGRAPGLYRRRHGRGVASWLRNWTGRPSVQDLREPARPCSVICLTLSGGSFRPYRIDVLETEQLPTAFSLLLLVRWLPCGDGLEHARKSRMVMLAPLDHARRQKSPERCRIRQAGTRPPLCRAEAETGPPSCAYADDPCSLCGQGLVSIELRCVGDTWAQVGPQAGRAWWACPPPSGRPHLRCVGLS
jgi:hypothetical protein